MTTYCEDGLAWHSQSYKYQALLKVGGMVGLKGQLISKGFFDVIVSIKKPTKFS